MYNLFLRTLFYHLNDSKKADLIVTVYVDDTILCGTEKMIEKFKDEFVNHIVKRMQKGIDETDKKWRN